MYRKHIRHIGFNQKHGVSLEWSSDANCGTSMIIIDAYYISVIYDIIINYRRRDSFSGYASRGASIDYKIISCFAVYTKYYIHFSYWYL